MEEMNIEDAKYMINLIHGIVRNNYYDDKEAMMEIVKIFEHYGMNCGTRRTAPQVLILTE